MVLSGTGQVYWYRPIPSVTIPAEVVATGVPWPESGAPDWVMPIVTPLAAHAWPEFMLDSNWTISSSRPPGKTSELALLYGARVGIG
jgi:hypothetical protein